MARTAARRTRPRRRLLAVYGVGAALAVAMTGQVAAGPQASAGCTLTGADDRYIELLAQNKISHPANYSDCDITAEGRWIADQVRNAPDPFDKANSLVQMVTDRTPMTAKQAEWKVESAIYTYAPQTIPEIKGEAAQQPPA